MVEREDQPVLAATAMIVGVAFDYLSNATVVIPDDWREKITGYEK